MANYKKTMESLEKKMRDAFGTTCAYGVLDLPRCASEAHVKQRLSLARLLHKADPSKLAVLNQLSKCAYDRLADYDCFHQCDKGCVSSAEPPAQLTITLQQLQEQLKQVTMARDQLQTKVQTQTGQLRGASERMKTEIAEVKAQSTRLQAELDAAHHDATVLARKVQQTENNHLQRIHQLEVEVAEKETLKKNLLAANQRGESLDTRLRELEETAKILGADKIALTSKINSLQSEKATDERDLSDDTAKAIADLADAKAALELEKQAHQTTKNASAEVEKVRDEELTQLRHTQTELEEANSTIDNLRKEVARLQQMPQQVASTSAAAVIPAQPAAVDNPRSNAILVNPPPPQPVRPFGHPPVKDVDDDYEKYNNQRNRDKKRLAEFGAKGLNATVKARTKLLEDIANFKSKCQAKLDSGTLTPWMVYEREKTMLSIWRIETNLEAQILNQQAKLPAVEMEEEEVVLRMPARKKPKKK